MIHALTFAATLSLRRHYYPSMTFNMHVQAEQIHLSPFPYLADRDDKTSLWWENEWVNTGTMGTYSVLGGTYSFTAAVGVSFVTDPLGNRVAYTEAGEDFNEFPLLYHSIDTRSFNVSRTYDADSQTSWGTLTQIVDSFPADVPKVEGNLVPHRNNSIAVLKTGEMVFPY